MKRFSYICVFILIGLIAACSQDTLGGTIEESCNEFGCVSIKIEHPVQAMVPTVIRIGVFSTKKNEELRLSLGMFGVESVNFEKLPEGTEIVLSDNQGVVWNINAEADKEYLFEGTIVLSEPPYKPGSFSYKFYVVASYPGGGPIRASASIHLDGDGNQIDSQTAKILQETVSILPLETDFITFPTYTPNPTIRIPSATATPSATSTLPAYPPPGENVGIGSDGKSQPDFTATLPAYPGP